MQSVRNLLLKMRREDTSERSSSPITINIIKHYITIPFPIPTCTNMTLALPANFSLLHVGISKESAVYYRFYRLLEA
jgi:hypothetical protein